jgi:KTSC domain
MSWIEISNVDSSNIAALRYNEADQVMEVTFHNGGVYQYFDVPQHVWQGMLDASSKGSYLHANVKGAFRYARV